MRQLLQGTGGRHAFPTPVTIGAGETLVFTTTYSWGDRGECAPDPRRNHGKLLWDASWDDYHDDRRRLLRTSP